MKNRHSVWLFRCDARPGYEEHNPMLRPVRGGGAETRCSFCDRTRREAEYVHGDA